MCHKNPFLAFIQNKSDFIASLVDGNMSIGDEADHVSDSVYKVQPPPQDWIKQITSTSGPSPTPRKPFYGLDSPMDLLASNIAAPLYLYASLKGKHDLWDSLLKNLSNGDFKGPALDMGCGRGTVLLNVAQREKAIQNCSPVDGSDIFNSNDQSGNSPEATHANAASLEVLGNVVLHTASFTEKLPFADEVFSLITSSLALHNVDIQGRIGAIEELARTCRPGAKVPIVDLMGYAKGFLETLTSLGWKDIHCEFAGVGSMFGMWPCQIIRAIKPS